MSEPVKVSEPRRTSRQRKDMVRGWGRRFPGWKKRK
jgi:hypothetical protein